MPNAKCRLAGSLLGKIHVAVMNNSQIYKLCHYTTRRPGSIIRSNSERAIRLLLGSVNEGVDNRSSSCKIFELKCTNYNPSTVQYKQN